jgi:pSer/pThr/pTyr-binding forkhead associated (FHA) protein
MNRLSHGSAGSGQALSRGFPPPLLVRTQGSGRSLAAGPSYLVGRDPEADIVIDDARVSWQHAVLRLEDSRWVLADNGSTNGSYAEGRRADRIEIDGECLVRLGDPADGPALSCTVSGAAGTLRIGRSLDNDIVVADLSVSSHHAELQTVAGMHRIVDLGSHNGTFVNEQRVTVAQLSEGDTVGLGDSTFRLAGRELQELALAGPGTRRCRPPPTPAALWPAARPAMARPVMARPVMAAARSRSRTRFAGWCRRGSGSRTSTS